MIERHYSHLTPRLRKEVLTGKRFELSPEEYRRSQGIKGMAVAASDVNTTVGADDEVEEQLPNEPEMDGNAVETDEGEHQNEVTVIDTDDLVVPRQSRPDTAKSAAERAFDLFDAGKIGEAGLLAALGVSRPGYVPTEAVAHRALDAVEAGRLSEAALTQVLGA